MTIDTMAAWHQVAKDRDIEALYNLLHDDAVFHSPVVHKPQVGKAITGKYLSAALHVFFNDSFEYVREVHGEGNAILEFEVEIQYMASPDLTDKVVLLSDPMLATGRSMVLAYKALLKKGVPSKIHVVCVIGSEQGVEYISKNLPENTTLWIGGIDSKMTSESYIVPGLGDAGDLAFGKKLD